MTPPTTTALSQLSEAQWQAFVQDAQLRLQRWRQARQGHLTVTSTELARRCA